MDDYTAYVCGCNLRAKSTAFELLRDGTVRCFVCGDVMRGITVSFPDGIKDVEDKGLPEGEG